MINYHDNRTHLTSSALKVLLRDGSRAFNEYWNLQSTEKVQKDVYDVGTLTHSLLLEPELVATSYAFYPGLRRAGAAYELFKAQNPGKLILTEPQRIKAENYAQTVRLNPEAVKLLSVGVSELTIEGELLGVKAKCRADKIDYDSGIIIDVKTTGYPGDVDTFRNTVKEYRYDLSASMYLELAEARYGKPFEFYFIVISKPELTCSVYKLSKESREVGRDYMVNAIVKYKRCVESGIWLDDKVKPSYTEINIEEV